MLFVRKESFDMHGKEVHGEDVRKPGQRNCKYIGNNLF